MLVIVLESFFGQRRMGVENALIRIEVRISKFIAYTELFRWFEGSCVAECETVGFCI